MLTPIIQITNVNLSYKNSAGTVKILNELSFKIMPGEAVALVGPSGSGKSSVLMLIGGMEKPNSGSIFVLGRKLSSLNESTTTSFRKNYIGVIFQAFHLIQTMTALENVRVPLELAGEKKSYSIALNALRKVGLAHRLNHYPSQLSGGEQQRVALARAVVRKPKIILADEPTGSLDKTGGEQINDLLFDLSREYDATLIIATHSQGLASRCNRQIFLENGQAFDKF